ncbi:MAG: hypothetical protein ACQEXX_13705 [Bacillota bacterium]
MQGFVLGVTARDTTVGRDGERRDGDAGGTGKDNAGVYAGAAVRNDSQ